jgi:biopolymer transport protein ExbD
MRRFSQRNLLVTLNEINITPLLDLAFVLLIIFIITRPLLEQSEDLKVPNVGHVPAKEKIQPNDVQTIEINAANQYRLGGLPRTSLAQIESELVRANHINPRMVVNIRADERANWKTVNAIIFICMKNGITRVCPQVAPAE